MPTEPTGEEPYTPVKIKTTSATERSSFRRCRRQWFLTVVHRLDPQEGNVNFFLGTLFHVALEKYYTALKRGKSLDEAEDAGLDAYKLAYELEMDAIRDQLGFAFNYAQPLWEETADLGWDMVINYFAQEQKEPLLDEVIAVEFRVEIPILSPKGRKTDGRLSVQADVVGRLKGNLRVVDHKSATRDYPSAMMELDDQHTAEAYSWWKHSGEFPDEVVRNIAKKRVPEPPRLIRKGTALSVSKSQYTTSEMFEQAIIDNGFSRLDYAAHLEWLRQQEREGSKFFTREVTFRSPDQMASFEQNLYQEWRDMRLVAREPERAYPNPSTFNCPSCSVKAVCMAMQDGGDAAAIIKAGYVVADARR